MFKLTSPSRNSFRQDWYLNLIVSKTKMLDFNKPEKLFKAKFYIDHQV